MTEGVIAPRTKLDMQAVKTLVDGLAQAMRALGALPPGESQGAIAEYLAKFLVKMFEEALRLAPSDYKWRLAKDFHEVLSKQRLVQHKIPVCDENGRRTGEELIRWITESEARERFKDWPD